jgi:hypothetical protein
MVMNQENLTGHDVTVESARGEIRRTVIADLGTVLVLGSVSDYNLLKTRGLDRFAIGFRRSDVTHDFGIDSSVSLKHNVQYEQAEHGQEGTDR